jgi:hypothetical protein
MKMPRLPLATTDAINAAAVIVLPNEHGAARIGLRLPLRSDCLSI